MKDRLPLGITTFLIARAFSISLVKYSISLEKFPVYSKHEYTEKVYKKVKPLFL